MWHDRCLRVVDTPTRTLIPIVLGQFTSSNAQVRAPLARLGNVPRPLSYGDYGTKLVLALGTRWRDTCIETMGQYARESRDSALSLPVCLAAEG